jgi:glutaredoxin
MHANLHTMYFLFTTQTCPNCPQAKKLLSEQSFSGSLQLIDASTQDGLKKAQEHDVCQVPTLVRLNDDGHEEERYAGITEISNFFS